MCVLCCSQIQKICLKYKQNYKRKEELNCWYVHETINGEVLMTNNNNNNIIIRDVDLRIQLNLINNLLLSSYP